MTGKRILLAIAALLVSTAIGIVRYRGPSPLGLDASPDRPSAARMRQTLEYLLGDPPQGGVLRGRVPPRTHRTGTPQSDAFLERLESTIESHGVTTQRIEIPWVVETDPPDLKLKNLLATVPGREPSLQSVLIATHHDSCRHGPGAGDAGSAVVALVENIRIAAKHQPRRTTHFLFTDGEESGLQGAIAISQMEMLPLGRPVFVLNFDARGTRGGVPMFETHPENKVWVHFLIHHLADPKMTSSLAVTVYRTLPNATDFDVWNAVLGWHGFNYATIGGAEHYHQPSDVPENLSDRTLQHMGDQVYEMRRALDVEDLPAHDADAASGNAVFFDVYGYVVVCYGERFQIVIAILAVVLIGLCSILAKPEQPIRVVLRHGLAVVLMLVLALAVGVFVELLLKSLPWGGLPFTPVDYPAGLLTLAASFLVTTVVLEWLSETIIGQSKSFLCDWTWFATAAIGAVLAFALPGGAYLLVMPAATFAIVRVVSRNAVLASWGGWLAMVVIAGPTLALLVQALGPWMQPLYGMLAGLMAIQAMTAWAVPVHSPNCQLRIS